MSVPAMTASLEPGQCYTVYVLFPKYSADTFSPNGRGGAGEKNQRRWRGMYNITGFIQKIMAAQLRTIRCCWCGFFLLEEGEHRAMWQLNSISDSGWTRRCL